MTLLCTLDHKHCVLESDVQMVIFLVLLVLAGIGALALSKTSNH